MPFAGIEGVGLAGTALATGSAEGTFVGFAGAAFAGGIEVTAGE